MSASTKIPLVTFDEQILIRFLEDWVSDSFFLYSIIVILSEAVGERM